MSDDLLIRAARKLRDSYDAATAGPWTVERLDDGHGEYVLYNVLGPTYDDGVTPIPLQTRTEDAGYFSQAEADVSYAVLMHPPVAMLLADLLERICVAPRIAVMPSVREYAERVAREILRETTP